jgi:hypothetical protein
MPPGPGSVALVKGFYANLTITDQQSIDDNFGANRARLMQIKKQFDPVNLFRLNPNIGA